MKRPLKGFAGAYKTLLLTKELLISVFILHKFDKWYIFTLWFQNIKLIKMDASRPTVDSN